MSILVGVRDALVDIGRLLLDGDRNTTRLAVEADLGAGVADVGDRATHDRGDVDVGRGRDLTGDDHPSGRDQGFASHAGERVAGEDLIEYRIGDLVGHLVGMSLGDRLRGE
jgi:hypothetical protein